MDVFWEIYTDQPQQGPGTDNLTLKALSMIPDLPAWPSILDVGCGTGRQTIVLAKQTSGKVTAVDNHQPFLNVINEKAKLKGISDRIITRNSSMDDMDYTDRNFDLIWSEGAVYIMGFQKGLAYWKRFLRPGGAIAVTEISWIKANPPDEILSFWHSEYPAIKTIDKNLNIIRQLGYSVIDYFTLPENAWYQYYEPIENRIVKLREKYAGNTTALEVIESNQLEIDLYRKYSDYYGYVFYIMRKPI
ncbi:MAG: class I SAM-dependent methyltransferase [candidate division Zixibacteria bacterium]|nr:class I SAM-dependent methyltransferase [candidate division Zixibacteria bacterium]